MSRVNVGNLLATLADTDRILAKMPPIVCERDVVKYLKLRVVAEGGEIRKVKWIGRRNAPDLRVMVKPYAVWVEVKRPGKLATAAQAREHARMRQHGETVIVVCSLMGVDRMLYALCHSNGPLMALYV